jgi:hypothetical protein
VVDGPMALAAARVPDACAGRWMEFCQPVESSTLLVHQDSEACHRRSDPLQGSLSFLAAGEIAAVRERIPLG